MAKGYWTCRFKDCGHQNPKPKRKCLKCGRLKPPKKLTKHQQLLKDSRPLYEKLLEAQGGHCALCSKKPTKNRRLDFDHDHKTMKIRGLLCFRCNRALPYWMNSEWLRRAANYVETTE